MPMGEIEGGTEMDEISLNAEFLAE